MSNSQYPQTRVVAETSGWAIFSLIAGILGWLGVVGVGGIAAIIAGHIAKNQIRSSYGRIGGDGLATVGLVLGYLNVGLAVFGGCLALLVFGGIITVPLFCVPFMSGI